MADEATIIKGDDGCDYIRLDDVVSALAYIKRQFDGRENYIFPDTMEGRRNWFFYSCGNMNAANYVMYKLGLQWPGE